MGLWDPLPLVSIGTALISVAPRTSKGFTSMSGNRKRCVQKTSKINKKKCFPSDENLNNLHFSIEILVRHLSPLCDLKIPEKCEGAEAKNCAPSWSVVTIQI